MAVCLSRNLWAFSLCGEDITLNFREIDRALIYCFNPCLSNSWLWRNLEFLRNQDFVALISWFSFWFLTVSCLTILIACHGCFCFLLFFECEDNPNKPIAKNCLMNFNSQMKALAASENRKSVRTQDAKNVKVENAQMLWEHIQAKAKPFFAAQHFKLATMSPNDTEYWMWGLWGSFDKCASRGLSCWRWFLLSKCNKRYDSWRLVPQQNVQPVPRPALKPPSRGRKGLLETWNAKTHNSGISNLETLESQKQGSDRGGSLCWSPEPLWHLASLRLTLWSQAKRLHTFKHILTISTFSALLPLRWSLANHFRGTWRAYFVEEQMWNSFPRVVAAAVASCCSSSHLGSASSSITYFHLSTSSITYILPSPYY